MLERLRRRLARDTVRLLARAPARRPGLSPTVSITFDDFLETSATLGADILERRGCRGTFYANGATIGGMGELGPVATEARLRAVHAAGHEIGCHTWGHVDVARLDGAAIGADLDRNAAWLDQAIGPGPRSFAYPYGRVALRAKPITAARFLGARGVESGVHGARFDRALIRGTALESVRRDAAHLRALIAAAARDGGWLVLYTHDVSPTPTAFGVTPQDLDWVVAESLGAGCRIRTMAEVLRETMV